MKRFLFVVLCLGLTGCATTTILPKSVVYDSTKIYSATNPDTVRIFQAEPPQKYIKIGEIVLESPNYGPDAVGDILAGAANNWGRETADTFEKKLKDEAGRIGGDAIIILKDSYIGIQGGGKIRATSHVNQDGSLETEGKVAASHTYGRKVTGVVIKFE